MNTGSTLVAERGPAIPRRPQEPLAGAARLAAERERAACSALFMWGHMFFVSSILLGKDAMWTVTKFFEGYFFFGTVVSRDRLVRRRRRDRAARRARDARACASSRSTIGSTATFRDHCRHDAARRHDALVVAGRDRVRAVLPRLDAPVRDADAPGAHRSVRVAPTGSGAMHYWPLYLVLLFAVELHGGIGLYRLAVKWGWFAGARCRTRRGAA